MNQEQDSLEKVVATNLMYLVSDTIETCLTVVEEEGGLKFYAKQQFNTIAKASDRLSNVRRQMPESWQLTYGEIAERVTKILILLLDRGCYDKVIELLQSEPSDLGVNIKKFTGE